MNLKTPKNWRQGQTLFNFLEWLRSKGYPASERMADPFGIPDEEMDKLVEEWNAQN